MLRRSATSTGFSRLPAPVKVVLVLALLYGAAWTYSTLFQANQLQQKHEQDEKSSKETVKLTEKQVITDANSEDVSALRSELSLAKRLLDSERSRVDRMQTELEQTRQQLREASTTVEKTTRETEGVEGPEINSQGYHSLGRLLPCAAGGERVECSDSATTDFQRGVASVMRFLDGSGFYERSAKQDALEFFDRALEEDASCVECHLLSSLVHLHDANYDKMETALKAAELLIPTCPRPNVYRGLSLELRGQSGPANAEYSTVERKDPDAVKAYWGVVLAPSSRDAIRKHGNRKEEETALLDMVIVKDFYRASGKGFYDYYLYHPESTDFFVNNEYFVLRKMIPPFALRALQKCYDDMIENGALTLGDPQVPTRYLSYNERVIRFVQYQLTDLISKMVGERTKPTYTYFGGYTSGSILDPHTDRPQCEFTVSFKVLHKPDNHSWKLGLEKKGRTLAPDFPGKPHEKMPDENGMVEVELMGGDGLLFKGRHHTHWRRFPLPEGERSYSAFLHYVKFDFAGSLN